MAEESPEPLISQAEAGSQEPQAKLKLLCKKLFKKAEGKNGHKLDSNPAHTSEANTSTPTIEDFPEDNAKDLLVQVINDAKVDVTVKKDFYNKLLRKAVFCGNVDMVELVLAETKGIVDIDNMVTEDDVGVDLKEKRTKLNPALIGWTPLHFAANIASSFKFRNSLNINNSAHDEVTLSLTMIMLLWRNGADPMLGERKFPVDVDDNRSIVTLLLRILMELKDATSAAATPLDTADDDHKTLLEWACRCGYVEVATRVLARVNDPESVLLQAVKGTKNVFHLMGKKMIPDVLGALYRKYPNLHKDINGRTPAQDNESTHDCTPLSIACQVNNDKFFQWALKCFNSTLTVIDLYNTGLTGELPLKLFGFTKLKELNVSNNKLKGISEVDDCVAFACGELEKAMFADNKFTIVPKGLFLLPKLRELNFAKNAVEALDLDGIEVQNISINKLDLSGNRIKKVPCQLFCLPHLAELKLDNNLIAELPVEIWFAPRLNQFSINYNFLDILPVPKGIGDAVDHELYTTDSQPSIASSYVSVKSRYSQSFRETMMSPSETIEFEEVDIRVQHSPSSCGLQLKRLQLNNNRLRIIPPNLPCLAPSLQTLLVANNELDVTPCIRNLPPLLKRLDLSHNRLTKFLAKTFAEDETYPSELCPRKCFYGSEQTCAAHHSHNKLVRLDHLDMSHNMIDDDVNTKYDGIPYYENLLHLNLSNNQLKKFPDFVLHQPFLWTLDISNNPDIETIPYELSRLEQLFSFKHDGISAPIARDLNTWPSTAEKLAYLRSMMGRAEVNNSVKLMVVGMYGKGKTTLLNRLEAKGRFQESFYSGARRLSSPSPDGSSNTVGIKIGTWSYCIKNNPTNEFPEIEFYTWDYAGEEEYYATHQLFLHARTLYLVVWNMLNGDDGVYGLLPWLQGIHAKAPRSVVIIVGTHLDLIPQSDHDTKIRRYKELIEQCFSNKHCSDLPNYWPEIGGVYFVGLKHHRSSTPYLNVDELRDNIYDTALNLELPIDELAVAMRAKNNTKMMKEMVPVCYKQFQQQVIAAGMAIFREGDVFPILKYKEFETIANNMGIPEGEVNGILLFLQSKGFIVRFEFRKLSKQYFIDPEWLNSVFALLISPKSVETLVQPGFDRHAGAIQRNHLEERLKDKGIQSRHTKHVVDLLEEFHIAIPMEFNKLLVPALLEDDSSNTKLTLGTFPRPPTLKLNPPQPEHLPTPIAATPPIQLLSTGVVVRRLYVLHGIPIGFWPRLISHFYTEKVFFKIINKALCWCRKDPGEEYAPRWNYSKRNIWLTVKNTTLLAVGVADRDYMDMHQNSQCRKVYLTNLHYINEGHWLKSKFQFNSGVLIEVNDFAFVSSSDSEPVITCVPDMFRHTAELLTFAVEMIDSLFSEVFHRPKFHGDTSWVKELIPCPFCLGDKPVDGSSAFEVPDLEDKVRCCDQHDTIQDLSQDMNIIYYFHINQCLLKADSGDSIACPKHGYLPLNCLAPDLVFQDIPMEKVFTPASFSQHYEELKKEESGAFGNVYKDYQTKLAIKIIKSQSLSGDKVTEQTYKDVRKEIDKLLYFEVHPHIVNVLGVLLNPHGIVLELAPIGDLKSVIKKYQYRNNLICCTALLLTVQQVSSALKYLHGQRIVHRDVKPSNVLVFSYPDENHVCANNPQRWNCDSCLHAQGSKVRVKLSDFGVGIRVTAFRLLCNEGTEGYKAPEVAGLSSMIGYNEKVDIFSLAMVLYVMLTLRSIPLKGIPNFGEFIKAGKRPKFTTLDPVYPVIFYECVLHCWKQDYSKRPSAEMVSTRLQNFQSSPVNKYTLEMFSFIATIAVVSVDGVQCLWAVTEYPLRRLGDPSVQLKTELTVIHQSHLSRLEFTTVEELPSNIEDKICVCQLHKSVVVGYRDQLAIYDASSKTRLTPYHPTLCATCTCDDLQCLELYANNLTVLFAGQSSGNVHILSLEDNQHPDSLVKYCFELPGENLKTMKACWYETHVELWCSTGPDLIDILRFPVDVAECNHQLIQDNIISLDLTTTGLVVAIECCVADDRLLVFTMAEQASVVSCWDGHSKDVIKNICLSEIATCIRVVEPNLYIGTESGDCMLVELQHVACDQHHINVEPHSSPERYVHHGPVEALVAASGTVGCQGNLMKVFLSPEGEDHHGNEFTQEVPCSLVLSIGHGYSSPWNTSENKPEKDSDDPEKGDEEVDNDLCVLVHLV